MPIGVQGKILKSTHKLGKEQGKVAKRTFLKSSRKGWKKNKESFTPELVEACSWCMFNPTGGCDVAQLDEACWMPLKVFGSLLWLVGAPAAFLELVGICCLKLFWAHYWLLEDVESTRKEK